MLLSCTAVELRTPFSIDVTANCALLVALVDSLTIRSIFRVLIMMDPMMSRTVARSSPYTISSTRVKPSLSLCKRCQRDAKCLSILTVHQHEGRCLDENHALPRFRHGETKPHDTGVGDRTRVER